MLSGTENISTLRILLSKLEKTSFIFLVSKVFLIHDNV